MNGFRDRYIAENKDQFLDVVRAVTQSLACVTIEANLVRAINSLVAKSISLYRMTGCQSYLKTVIYEVERFRGKHRMPGALAQAEEHLVDGVDQFDLDNATDIAQTLKVSFSPGVSDVQ